MTLRHGQPEKVGGHLLVRAGREKGANGQALYRCQTCGTTGNYGLFNIIGQRDFCPEDITSMNGYIWFNADDPSVALQRAADQWVRNARRCEFAVPDYQVVHDRPGICATFTWREQAYVVRYGEDAERGMRANDLRAELDDQEAEQAGA